LQPTFGPGDEILTTSHVYGAVRKTLQYVCDVTGASLVEAYIPFPIENEQVVVDAVATKLTPRTKFALIDHVTSSTGILYPIEKIIPMLTGRGVQVMIDGAHVPGMLDLDIASLGVDYYTGNCHKWLFAPKGSAFLWTKPEHQPKIHPVVISQNYGLGYQMEFAWVGTRDFTAWLSIGAGMDFAESLGMNAMRDYNHSLLMDAREKISAALGVGYGAPESMLISLCTIPLPTKPVGTPQNVFKLHDLLIDKYGIQVPAMSVNNEMYLRFSTQVYNDASQYDALADALVDIFNTTSFA
jgi:isopenicillin-N epimerase